MSGGALSRNQRQDARPKDRNCAGAAATRRQLPPTARSATLSGERTLPASAARRLASAASTRSTPAASHGGGQREALRSSNSNSDRYARGAAIRPRRRFRAILGVAVYRAALSARRRPRSPVGRAPGDDARTRRLTTEDYVSDKIDLKKQHRELFAARRSAHLGRAAGACLSGNRGRRSASGRTIPERDRRAPCGGLQDQVRTQEGGARSPTSSWRRWKPSGGTKPASGAIRWRGRRPRAGGR